MEFDVSEIVNCPICNGITWYKTGSRTQNKKATRWQTGYPSIQKHVFFDIWNLNKPIVEMVRNVCESCGFVIDLPRPNEHDVASKYQYLSEVEKNLGSVSGLSQRVMQKEFKQAVNILKLVQLNIDTDNESLDILDYGGGDGHILIPMSKRGHRCYIVDYNNTPNKTVEHLGNTIEDLSKEYKFDLIICRHVLEHVASPKELITKFKTHLKPQGLVYAEVPIQLFGKSKPNEDPVTHINYFQENSLAIMFEIAGYEPIDVNKSFTTYHGEPTIAAQVLAKKANLKVSKLSFIKSYNKTVSQINCSLLFKLYIKIRQPQKMMSYYLYRLFKK